MAGEAPELAGAFESVLHWGASGFHGAGADGASLCCGLAVSQAAFMGVEVGLFALDSLARFGP